MSIDYSIIIPAYNEEDYLTTTLNALQEAMPLVELSGEIIVVDNNSSDRTAEIAEAKGVKVVFEAINQISRARNAGAKEAQGRYLIFVDADTVIPHALLQQALVNLENGEIIGGGACVSGDVPLHFSMQCLLNFWNFISIQTRNAAGSFIYCHREDFETIGGFSEAVYASEEIWLSRSLKKLGKKENKNSASSNNLPSSLQCARFNGIPQCVSIFMYYYSLYFPSRYASNRYARCGTGGLLE
jgi:glycosyltransferase involved in cell wall biosynthesis